MPNNDPTIIWEKWVDPYGDSNEALPDWNAEDVDNSYDEAVAKQIKFKKNHVLLTNIGMIPYNEQTDCCKIFNFWIGHTNFPITYHVANIIQQIDGVETLDIFTRYRFRVSFGKAFVDRDVMNNINSNLSFFIKSQSL